MLFPDADTEGATRLTSISLAAVLLIGLSVGSYFLFASRTVERGARVMTGLEVVPHEMTADQTFKVIVHETMFKLCPYEIRWSLISGDHIERLRVVEPQRPAHPTVGDIVARNDHYVPAFIPPGDYTYATQVFDICPERTYVSSFSTSFRIKGAV